MLKTKNILTFYQSDNEVSNWIKWRTNQQMEFANSFDEGLSREQLVKFLISQNTVAATHAALEISPMNKNVLGILSVKYGELAAREEDEEMREFFKAKNQWYSKASE